MKEAAKFLSFAAAGVEVPQRKQHISFFVYDRSQQEWNPMTRRCSLFKQKQDLGSSLSTTRNTAETTQGRSQHHPRLEKTKRDSGLISTQYRYVRTVQNIPVLNHTCCTYAREGKKLLRRRYWVRTYRYVTPGLSNLGYRTPVDPEMGRDAVISLELWHSTYRYCIPYSSTFSTIHDVRSSIQWSCSNISPRMGTLQ